MAAVREKHKMNSPSPTAWERGLGGEGGLAPRLIGWHGFTLRVPEACDLTGFSGDDKSGYLRIDDSEELAIEIKWATEPAKQKTEPDPAARRETYFDSLQKTARKKKLDLQTKEVDAPRHLLRPDRNAAGFTWLGDRKAVGAVWYCRTCRRVVIAQVMGPRSGKGAFGTVSEAILGSLACHDREAGWRTWALYDLTTQVPSEYALVSQQLMNVYLRLSFAHKASRLTVEQWALANVARRDAYLDVWLAANAKGEMREARFEASEGEAQGHPALLLKGGPAFGMPMVQVAKQMTNLRRPATRFSAVAWGCDPSNKLYLVEEMRAANEPDHVAAVAARTLCHEGPSGDH